MLVELGFNDELIVLGLNDELWMKESGDVRPMKERVAEKNETLGKLVLS
jgi:hypothetical protein